MFRGASEPAYEATIYGGIQELLNLFVYGKCPDYWKSAINVGMLMALKKVPDPVPLPENHIPSSRPIGIGGIYAAILSKATFLARQELITRHLKPLHFGTTKNGIEILVAGYTLGMHVHHADQPIMAALDVSNMFNSLSLGGDEGAFNQIDRIPGVRDLLPIYHALYKHGTILVGQRDGELKEIIKTYTGFRQGNQLSMAGACIAVHDILTRADEMMREGENEFGFVKAYLCRQFLFIWQSR